MAELGQEEKDKLWADLKKQWLIVKNAEKGGDPEKARRQINKIQKLLGLEITDFNKEEPKNVKEYTLEDAEKLFTDEELDLIGKAQDRAIAFRAIVAESTPRKYPDVKGNHAGIGQIVNLAFDIVKERLKL